MNQGWTWIPSLHGDQGDDDDMRRRIFVSQRSRFDFEADVHPK